MNNVSQPESNPLSTLSAAMADAVKKAEAWTVLVNARRRLPASGVIYSEEMVLTANHVVERDEDITIMRVDGKKVKAQVAGRDPHRDLALLRLESAGQEKAQIVENDPRVGQLVLALGRPFPEGIQASLGIITSKGGPLRSRRGGMLENYFTTDAVPYPGFSGGPLIDVEGRLIGINTSGLTRGSSLVIPTQLAWQIADTLAQHGKVRHGYLGVRSQPVSLPNQAQDKLGRDQKAGLLMVGIEEDSPAAKADLMIGDILVAMENQPLADPDDLISLLTGSLVGREIEVEILRAGQPQRVTVVVGEWM
jgi:serine protease DegQ